MQRMTNYGVKKTISAHPPAEEGSASLPYGAQTSSLKPAGPAAGAACVRTNQLPPGHWTTR